MLLDQYNIDDNHTNIKLAIFIWEYVGILSYDMK